MTDASAAKPWTANRVARLLHRGYLHRRHMVVVPNCYWTGQEADILIVTNGLKLIDVEIKVSRADLKADLRKDKWWRTPQWLGRGERPSAQRREWPPLVWRHYYVMPADVWRPDLAETLPPASGIVLVHDRPRSEWATCERRPRSNPDAKPLTATQACDLARLANLRMWEAIAALEFAQHGETTP